MNTPECVINPKSGRAVKTSGKLGKQILASQKDGKKEPHTQYKKPIGPVKPKEAYTQYKSANDVRPNRKDFEKKKELEKNGNISIKEYKQKIEDFIEYFSIEKMKKKIKFGSHTNDALQLHNDYNKLYKELVDLEKKLMMGNNGLYDSTILNNFKKDNKDLIKIFENKTKKINVNRKIQSIILKMPQIPKELIPKLKVKLSLMIYGNNVI